MKRALSLVAVMLATGLAFAADTQPVVSNIYAQDFTKGLGEYAINKAEGKQDDKGVTLTKTQEYGGVFIDKNKKADLSAYKKVELTLVNGDKKDIEIIMKIGSGQSDKRTAKEKTVAPGEKTLTWELEGDPVDLTQVTYLNFWIVEAGEHNVTFKKVSFK